MATSSAPDTTHRRTRLVLWAPRVLAMVFIGLVSSFALDVFGERRGLADLLKALAVHLTPSWILIAGLVLAWRRPWIGTIVYGLLGVAYIVMTLQREQPSLSVRLLWCVAIAGPALVVAAMYWRSWRYQQRRVRP